MLRYMLLSLAIITTNHGMILQSREPVALAPYNNAIKIENHYISWTTKDKIIVFFGCIAVMTILYATYRAVDNRKKLSERKKKELDRLRYEADMIRKRREETTQILEELRSEDKYNEQQEEFQAWQRQQGTAQPTSPYQLWKQQRQSAKQNHYNTL